VNNERKTRTRGKKKENRRNLNVLQRKGKNGKLLFIPEEKINNLKPAPLILAFSPGDLIFFKILLLKEEN